MCVFENMRHAHAVSRKPFTLDDVCNVNELTANAENRPFIDLGDYNGNVNPPSNFGSAILMAESVDVCARSV